MVRMPQDAEMYMPLQNVSLGTWFICLEETSVAGCLWQ